MTKIESLSTIDEQDLLINSTISESKRGNLYRTLKLSSKYIDPVLKKKIN